MNDSLSFFDIVSHNNRIYIRDYLHTLNDEISKLRQFMTSPRQSDQKKGRCINSCFYSNDTMECM